jgi:hypothetical protein
MASLKHITETPPGPVELDHAASGAQTPNTSIAAGGEVETTANVASGEPPKLYVPACGALCDILWWARRSS